MAFKGRVLIATFTLLLAILPAGAAAQSVDSATVETAILDVLLARGIIDEAEYEELLGIARSAVDAKESEIMLIESRLERLRAPDVQVEGGKTGKLTFSSPDGKWSMNIKGRVQARVESVWSDTSGSYDGVNFSVPRGRIGISGKAGAENVTYKIEIDAATNKKLFDNTKDDPKGSGFPDVNEKSEASVKDAWINWEFPSGDAVKFGHAKVPFGREALTSSGKLNFVDRSLANGEFAPGREPMMMFHGKATDKKVEYAFSVSNGDGEGISNVKGDPNNGLRTAARVVYHPLGPVKLDQAAFQTVDDGNTLISIGAGVQDVSDSSGKGSKAPAPGDETMTYGVDVQVLSGPFSFVAEHFERTNEPAGG
ncbi:MAG: porin, partial [Planctomycetota bacterium]